MEKTQRAGVSPVRAALSRANEISASVRRERAEAKLIRPEEVPGIPLFWRIVIAPYVAQYEGSIEVADVTEQAEKIRCSLGRIVQIGHHAFQSKTVAGLDLSKDPNIPKVGHYVLHELYRGVEVRLKGDRSFRILDETDILMVVTDPEQIRGYL